VTGLLAAFRTGAGCPFGDLPRRLMELVADRPWMLLMAGTLGQHQGRG